MTGFPWAPFAVNLAVAAGTAGAVMLLTFAVARAKGVHRLVDIAWGAAFAAVALAGYGLSAGHGDDGRRLLVTGATVLWGLRLSAHIARRGRGHGEDPRYDRLLARAPGSRDAYALRMVYLLQAALVWLISLPVQVAQYVPVPLGASAVAGTLLWAAGFVCESVGDFQLARFKADPANRGRIMDRGLWSWTRHPNYFGDFLVWWGLFLLACGNGQTAALAVVSPLVMSLLLTYGSGKRLLENQLSDRPGYAAYRARTSGFVPLPPRRHPHPEDPRA
ncbi:DUF1295 domain-containing protein [Streptomyces sp. P9-2B-2]|uniref:DUF1295 domain-containing protein n=1 Tax=Streptomyces TaxID=1883 RepID=UPI00224FC2BA|nr:MULTISPECIES: DUF1295 domain-containing protein [Streptomyces]MCX4638950.1 DUF1295 domain-containing protein [Streptomyces platensis]WJY42529.1 DUF1295 domain-containing protein [Streptomyces sp. P9-2B-2]